MVDAIVLGLIALVDLAFLIYRRRRRDVRVRREKMRKSLAIYVRRQAALFHVKQQSSPFPYR
jgi:hypothetical protein